MLLSKEMLRILESIAEYLIFLPILVKKQVQEDFGCSPCDAK